MTNSKVIITKASGDLAEFSRVKLESSLVRSGAFPGLARKIALEVEKNLAPGMTTQDIYDLSYILLKKEKERPIAARYSLKKAIMDLGPTGFPFEKFIAEVLKRRGYKTRVGVIMDGAFVQHEIDVEAEDQASHYFVECKFHNSPGRATDVKVPLYVHSRFEDVMGKLKAKKGECHPYHQAWVVTNTHLSMDAIKYGEGVGMKMIGWRYPQEGGVEDLIECVGLHPLTCLTTLNAGEKTLLLEKGIVLCQDLPQQLDMLKSLGIKDSRLRQVMLEVDQILSIKVKTECRDI